MKKEQIIDKYYREAAAGLNENILRDRDLWYSYVVNLPEHLRMIYIIGVFNQQVMNGGLHQYFFNRYGQFAFLTIEDLKLIKAFKTAGILEEALNLLNNEQYSIDKLRGMIFDRKIERIAGFETELVNALNELDNRYYLLDEDLEQLYIDYLESLQKGEQKI